LKKRIGFFDSYWGSGNLSKTPIITTLNARNVAQEKFEKSLILPEL
jgi:hypothetical protein